MFSATDPLASSPLAASGTTKLVTGSGNVSQNNQTLAGAGSRRKYHEGAAFLDNAAQIVNGTSQTIRILFGAGDVFQGVQTVLGLALYTRIISGSGDIQQQPQFISGTSVVSYLQEAAGGVSQAAQSVQGEATVTKTANAAADLFGPGQFINATGTRIRILLGEGNLIAEPQVVYGSEFWPITIKTPSAPLNIYEVSLKATSQPYSTTNKYLTIYQIPSYLELQTNGTFNERTVTGIITAFSATTDDGAPQSISLIVVRADTVFTFPVIPAFDVINGDENIIPMRDFNLVTGDVIQVKSLGSGDVTVSLSMLLNTQTYYEVL